MNAFLTLNVILAVILIIGFVLHVTGRSRVTFDTAMFIALVLILLAAVLT